MASTIASLFGPSAEEIVYERQKEERDRQAQQYQTTLSGLRDTPGAATGYALGYQSGQGLSSAVRGFQSGEGVKGKILGGLFGQSEQLEDPRIAKALQVRKAFEGMTAADMSDPDKLSALAEKLQASGNPEAALQVNDMATKARAAQAAAIPEVTKPTRFRLPDGTIVNGGYQNGRPVAYMPDGTLVAIQDFTVVGEGVTASGEQTLQTATILESLNIDWDAGLQSTIANQAAALLQNNPNVTDFATAVELIIQQRYGTSGSQPTSIEQVDHTTLGLPRAANSEAGEQVKINKNGSVSILSADGQVLHTSTKRLSDEQIARFTQGSLEGTGATMGQAAAGSVPFTESQRKARDKTIAEAIPEPLTAEREAMLRAEEEERKDRPKSRGFFTSTEEALYDYKLRQKNKKK
jgi:hypothetical protein